jgi:hypothetical protein
MTIEQTERLDAMIADHNDTWDLSPNDRAMLIAVREQRKCLLQACADYEAQLVWLADWCRERFGVENNSVIGREGWPYRLVEVVAKVVDDRMAGRACSPEATP